MYADFAALADQVLELRPLDVVADWPAYHLAIVRRADGVTVGRVLLRLDTDPSIALYAGNIGYEVDPPFRGHHHAARACRLLPPIARWHGVHELWIVTSPDNPASCRTAELVGATYVDTRPMPPDSDMFVKFAMRQAKRHRWVL